MQDNAFTPKTATVVFDSTAWQQVATAANNDPPTSFRIRNTVASVKHFFWSPQLASAKAPSILPTVVPALTAPVSNCIGMVASSVEVFCLPSGAWFLAETDGTFEVTGGEGI